MTDPYQVVRDFEEALCDYTGAPYCVTVDSCTNALFLCLMYEHVRGIGVTLPTHTYPGVANALVHAGCRIQFDALDWQGLGYYELWPLPIVDSAKFLSRDMWINEFAHCLVPAHVCLSFHARKPLAIGRGGAILTQNERSAEWFRIARFDGRHECTLPDDTLSFPGWNCYMTPEQAARGMVLLSHLPDHNIAAPDPYQDLSRYEFYANANREGDA